MKQENFVRWEKALKLLKALGELFVAIVPPFLRFLEGFRPATAVNSAAA